MTISTLITCEIDQLTTVDLIFIAVKDLCYTLAKTGNLFDSLEILLCNSLNFFCLIKEIFNIIGMAKFYCIKTNILLLPSSIINFRKLECLYLENINFTKVSKNILSFKKLDILYLSSFGHIYDANETTASFHKFCESTYELF